MSVCRKKCKSLKSDMCLSFPYIVVVKQIYIFFTGEQGILKGTDDYVSCGAHPGKLTEVYCFDHNDICCMTCVQNQHR